MKQNIWGKNLPELRTLMKELGAPGYRSQQLFDYMYKRGILHFDEMAQLPKALRNKLIESWVIDFPTIVREQRSSDRKTAKLLLRYSDNSLIETVLMNQPYGYSVCISTQVGCAVGCTFCASGLTGLQRNLTAAEMLAQIYLWQFLYDIKIHSFVLMGSGEPLQNYDNVLSFMKMCHDFEGLTISYRNMTLSTSGITPKIYDLAKEKLPITLALSLHAPNDTIRNQIMPISKWYPLPELLESLQFYTQTTRRRVTCEYSLPTTRNETFTGIL